MSDEEAENSKDADEPNPKRPRTMDEEDTKNADSTDEDEDEGAVCNICMENWTNSGEHRIASLKCGHFYGFRCIDRWLKSNSASASSCPNCNEKSTRKDIRVHYVAKLKAIDTSERDFAVKQLEEANRRYRDHHY